MKKARAVRKAGTATAGPKKKATTAVKKTSKTRASAKGKSAAVKKKSKKKKPSAGSPAAKKKSAVAKKKKPAKPKRKPRVVKVTPSTNKLVTLDSTAAKPKRHRAHGLVIVALPLACRGDLADVSVMPFGHA